MNSSSQTQRYVPLSAIKGRGSASALAHRFSQQQRDEFDDGWGSLAPACDAKGSMPTFATQIRIEQARSAISANDSPDIYFEYSINPYRGCEHGCIYCYARPTHSYLNLSPGLDFETQIIAKENIVEVVRAELAHARYQPKHINIGSATDCYQPVERELRLTRGLIELLGQVAHPFSLVTKSSGVERDLDLLADLAQRRLVAVYITVTTLDSQLSRILEPRAAAPYRRLKTIERLAQAGVPVGVSVAPQIPFINEDMEHVLQAASNAGAKRAFYTVLRLPWEVSPLFRQWLQLHYPDRASRVMARVQDMRGGKDYDASFSTRMKGQGIWAELIKRRFEAACHKHGFNRERIELDFSQFMPPAPAPRDSRQAHLF
jgi:DNA repair photolyase